MSGSDLLLEYLAKFFPILIFTVLALGLWTGNAAPFLSRSTKIPGGRKALDL